MILQQKSDIIKKFNDFLKLKISAEKISLETGSSVIRVLFYYNKRKCSSSLFLYTTDVFFDSFCELYAEEYEVFEEAFLYLRAKCEMFDIEFTQCLFFLYYECLEVNSLLELTKDDINSTIDNVKFYFN